MKEKNRKGDMPANLCEAPQPLVTSAVLIESSFGAFVVDLFGVDCPCATAEFVNMCRSKYFNGCIAAEIVPDNIIIFSHPVEVLRGQTFTSLTARANLLSEENEDNTAVNVNQLMHAEWGRMKGYLASLQQRDGLRIVQFLQRPATEAPGAINRRGLLLLEVPPKADDAAVPSGGGALKRSLVLTLSNRHMDYFEDRFMVIGEVREGIAIIEKLRAAQYLRLSSSSLSFSAGVAAARPIRLIRIKHTTVLPTVGTELFSGLWRKSGSGDSTNKSKTSPQLQAMASTFIAAGCFCHWAAQKTVRAVNSTIIRMLKESSASFFEKQVECQGTKFFVLEKTDGNDLVSAKDGSDDEVLSVEYNPHYHGDYLSSDGDDETTQHAISRKERENRHQVVMRMHQDKLNNTRALMLNLLNGVADVSGDLKPPENVLFVCKLNPLTTGEGLVMCFSQCGRVLSAEVLRDRKTGNSLCYGFVEFEDVDGCYRAFQKMDNALVDDHRIHVDFSQSVSKLWAQRQRELRKRARGKDEGKLEG